MAHYDLMQVAPTMVPLLKFYFHEEVRKAAVSGEQFCLEFSVQKLEFTNTVRGFLSFSNAGAVTICQIGCGKRDCSGP